MAASTTTSMRAMSEPADRGLSTRSYAGRPAIRRGVPSESPVARSRNPSSLAANSSGVGTGVLVPATAVRIPCTGRSSAAGAFTRTAVVLRLCHTHTVEP